MRAYVAVEESLDTRLCNRERERSLEKWSIVQKPVDLDPQEWRFGIGSTWERQLDVKSRRILCGGILGT